MKLAFSLLKLMISLIILTLVLIGTIYGISYLAGPPLLKQHHTTLLYDQDGELIKQNNINNDFIELEAISPHLLDATISIEDKDFFAHNGFDFSRIIGAIIKNIKSNQLKEGASTITQQLARNLYLNHKKTWKRKAMEAFYTIRLEMFYSKEEILASYLNTIYYGHGAYGIEAASTYFFNKSAADLTIAEAAMLAGIPKGPTYYSPFNDKEKAVERQQLILKTLLNEGKITAAAYHEAIADELIFSRPDTTPAFALHYQDFVLKEASELLGSSQELIASNGYKIYTTLDSSRQLALEEMIASQINETSAIEIGTVAMDTHTGAITALIGGNPHRNSPFNRAIDAQRMVGSTFKPFVYYAALEQGFTPTTMLLSEPTTFKLGENEFYKPSNYNGYYAYKPITLAQAIAVSDNIYAVKTNLFLKPETVINTTKQFGITSELPNVASLALGSASISVNEMVAAYGMIANGGRKIEGYTIEKIIDQNDDTIYQKTSTPGKQILKPSKAFLLTHLMTGMFDTRLGDTMHVTGASINDQLSRVYAGKSGTTEFDSWMIGYNPRTVAGVWVGYDNNEPITNVAENALAKQIWARFMESASPAEKALNFTIPANITWKMIDPTTGLIATSDCEVSKLMYFEIGTEPTKVCEHEKITLEEVTDESIEQEGLFQKIWQMFQIKKFD